MNSDQDICLSCGLCCDGTLFTRVSLTKKDNPDRLRELGVPVRADFNSYFNQPCAQLGNGACRIYEDRPAQCAKFRCLLLKSFQAGLIRFAEAKNTIELAKELRAFERRSPEDREGFHRFLKQTFGDQNGNPLP